MPFLYPLRRRPAAGKLENLISDCDLIAVAQSNRVMNPPLVQKGAVAAAEIDQPKFADVLQVNQARAGATLSASPARSRWQCRPPSEQLATESDGVCHRPLSSQAPSSGGALTRQILSVLKLMRRRKVSSVHAGDSLRKCRRSHGGSARLEPPSQLCSPPQLIADLVERD